MNDMVLNEVVEPIAKRFGFVDSSAEFTAYGDFKVKWTRSYSRIDLTVSDYLKDAPTSVIANIIEGLLKRIRGFEAPEHSDETCEYHHLSDTIGKQCTQAKVRSYIEEDGLQIHVWGYMTG